MTSQAIRRVDIEAVDGPVGGGIAQPLQGGPQERAATAALVREGWLGSRGAAIGPEPFAEGLDLAGDGPSLRLLLGRNPRVDGSANQWCVPLHALDPPARR